MTIDDLTADDLTTDHLTTVRPLAGPAGDRWAGDHHTKAVLTGIGRAVPPAMDQREVWEDYFAPRLDDDRLAHRLFTRTGISTRHAVVDPRETDVSEWGTGARMVRYAEDARRLGGEAVTAALADAGLAAADVGLFTVVSCTGYTTPGLDILLADDLGMPLTVRRLLVGHMGCYAAVPGLAAAADFVRSRGLPAVVLCVELPSLHVQPDLSVGDLQQVVAHALFADAAVAVVLQPDAPGGLELVDTGAATAPGTADLMTWEITDRGFRMGLSPSVPDVLGGYVEDAVAGLLKPAGLDVAEVRGWAVHPGGPRIVEVVAERLHLSDLDIEGSNVVLDTHGNCSSGTVLMVLDHVRRQVRPQPGDPVVAMAFGPGLTLCSALFRAT